MAECYRCGKSGNEVVLFDAISKEGVVSICEDCSRQDSIPVIRRPTQLQLTESKHPFTVYERLSSMAGLNAKEHKKKVLGPKDQSSTQKETTLRDLVDRNYQKKKEVQQLKPKPQPELIDNFHWVVMRARRFKKLTQGQVAKEIGESESAIKMIESGVLPENSHTLINKLESFLWIKIRKKKDGEEKPKEITIDRDTVKALTIADLREIKAEHDTKAIKDEIEEEISLNEEFKKKLEEIGREG